MVRARIVLAVLALGAAASGCGSKDAPSELGGLWSAGPAACAAGVGVRFHAEAIAAVYDDEREVLFQNPRYQVIEEGDAFRVRIRYALPHRPGGARSAGAYGVLVLERGEGGALHPASHNLMDGRTGSAMLRIENDPAFNALTLLPCDGGHPWMEALRGRSAG